MYYVHIIMLVKLHTSKRLIVHVEYVHVAVDIAAHRPAIVYVYSLIMILCYELRFRTKNMIDVRDSFL